ncbi:hypothetical protein [Burkholderia glumae]|uniref:hypothetical protein n=1 Tax=Burkholderia glumae TaxID=337 RepID=UPI00265D959B|nr:hypothetical protein [Burkholderia glumae]
MDVAIGRHRLADDHLHAQVVLEFGRRQRDHRALHAGLRSREHFQIGGGRRRSRCRRGGARSNGLRGRQMRAAERHHGRGKYEGQPERTTHTDLLFDESGKWIESVETG